MKKDSSMYKAEFVETICIEKGRALNLVRHNERMNKTRHAFWGDGVEDLSLEDWINPEHYEERTRCRVVYAQNVVKVEYFTYHMRKVESLKMVECDEADYQYKYADRTLLNELYEQRGNADDVLIVRNGYLTDTSIANIALFNGTEWHTPTFPLLKGTRRQSLIDEGQIHERQIKADQLKQYQKIRLFNAMIPFGVIEFDVKDII